MLLAIVPTVESNPSQTELAPERRKVIEAFSLVIDAEKAGGNVTGLVASLNVALNLIDQAESASSPETREELLGKADRILDDVLGSAPQAKEEGLRIQRNGRIWLGLWLGTLGFLGFVVYRYGPEIFWRTWFKVHGEWRVRSR